MKVNSKPADNSDKLQVSAKKVCLKQLFQLSIVVTMGLTTLLIAKGLSLKMQQMSDKNIVKNVQNASSIIKNVGSIVLDVASVIPTIYVITPTYHRLEQKAELTRMSNTLLHVKHLHWIVVEDSNEKTELVTHFLATCRVIYTHLNISTPDKYRSIASYVSKAVLQRNIGLDWIRTNLDPAVNEGVVFFGDDDNTYSLKLFEEMRYTQRVSVWPVGLVAGLKHESPIVKNGKVVGWRTNFMPSRKFAIDMAGFAVNIKLILTRTKAKFSYAMPLGTLETSFLTALGTEIEDLEPRADGCTKVLVWHTRTAKAIITHSESEWTNKSGLEQFADVEV